jgi:hypothetical protein
MTGAELGAPASFLEIAPLVRRMVSLDPKALIRIRRKGPRLSGFVFTPFAVLAARSIHTEAIDDVDATVGGAELLNWIDDFQAAEPPRRRDVDWRWALPPDTGWRQLDAIPGQVLRGLVRSGALTLKEAADREGVPGAQPRAEVADALLDSVVLTVTGEGRADITLRTVSALTRLGFLARDSHASVAVAGRWVRVAGNFGSVYAESAPSGLSVLR